MAKTPTWQRAAGKNPEGGLNEAGRRSLRAAGHDIKRPQPEGGPRKKSFCARMKGMKAQNTSAETANDPNSRINKSLRKWKCADGGEVTVENALRLTRKGDKIPLRPYEPRWNESTGKFDSPQNKGIGFAGPLKQRGADHVVSEYSRDEDFQYPTIHSGMSAADRAAVMEAERLSEPKYQGDDIISERLNRAQKPFDIPQDVDRRAYEAAKERIQAGRSPFFEQGRDPYPTWSPEQHWEEPAVMPNRPDPLMYAEGGEVAVDNALRMAQGRPDEGGQERFLREQLAGSAPQYEPSQDFPARAERAVQAADRYAGVLNDLAARGAGLPKEFQSPQGRSAREIVESALPQDPNAVVKQAMRQAGEGNRLAAAETMLGGIPETGAIRAYHGSPHRFDRFDISKIGTGEGAQAYGHGLYFAESEPVARSYRDALSGAVPHDVQLAMKSLDNLGYNSVGTAIANARLHPDWMKRWDVDPTRSKTEELAANIINKHISQPRGHIYEVEIAAEPHQLLDWDKPLSEQPEAVRAFLDKDLRRYLRSSYEGQMPNFEGKSAGEILEQTQGRGLGGEKLSRSAVKAGIPGIQYLDAGSRGAGEGSRNFVIFDPSLIDIKRRYAEGGDVTVDNALRMARNMGGALPPSLPNISPTPMNPPQDPGPQQPYYQSLAQTRDIIQQYGAPAPAAPTSSAVRQPMPYADGGKAVWNKPRPKSLGKSEPLSPSQKSSAKAMAKAAGRPYPNMVDNIRAARKADGGPVEGDVQFAPADLPMMARQPDVEIENALRMAKSAEPVRYDTGPQPGEAVMRSYDPTIKEHIYQGVAGTEQRPSPERAQFARGISQMAEFVPVLGNVMAGQEAYRRGDTKGMIEAIVPLPTAKITGLKNLPTSEIFKRAVEVNPKARIEEGSLVLPVVRGQKIEQELAPSTRGGVFYLPEGDKNMRYYSNSSDLYGGEQIIKGETAFNSPLFVKGGTGGKAPEAAYESLSGKGSLKQLDDDIFQIVNESSWLPKKDKDLFLERIESLLKHYGVDYADKNLAQNIIDNSKRGNQLRYALREHIIGNLARKSGYDSIIGYGVKRDPLKTPFMSEIFDLRESHYPSPTGAYKLHEQYNQNVSKVKKVEN